MLEKAAILFSGGIDSTTALYWARQEFTEVTALIVRYGQRHQIEASMAEKICRTLYIPFSILDLPLDKLLCSALLDETLIIPENLASSKSAAGVPFTYVPFRNGIFLALAAGFAESHGIRHLITGFNHIDSPDYPDTTADFVAKMTAAINAGTSAALTGQDFTIHTPLLHMTKKDIIAYGLTLNADYSHSVSCYRGDEMPCGHCPSCDIRARAFAELGMPDPLIVRLSGEGRA
jgi:7-cyano-7-deazaguanine synthase